MSKICPHRYNPTLQSFSVFFPEITLLKTHDYITPQISLIQCVHWIFLTWASCRNRLHEQICSSVARMRDLRECVACMNYLLLRIFSQVWTKLTSGLDQGTQTFPYQGPSNNNGVLLSFCLIKPIENTEVKVKHNVRW